MASRNPSKFVSGSAYTYAVSLRVRHPTADPAVLTQTLKLDPAHSWKAGEPRRSQTGAALSGQYRDSYWSASLPGQMVGGASVPLEIFIAQQLLQLGRHRDFFSGLQADGGEVSLLVEIAPIANAVLTLSSTVARRLADLNIEVEFQFPGD
jgi:nucleotidyltransferase/DNA polymerase involved in DNA repair